MSERRRIVAYRSLGKLVPYDRSLEPWQPDDLALLAEYPRPQTRADCMEEARPCPFVSCRYHLALTVTDAGSVKVADNWDDGRPTCALDMADEGRKTLEQIGEAMALTRERVRQVEANGLRKLRREVHSLGHVSDDEGDQ